MSKEDLPIELGTEEFNYFSCEIIGPSLEIGFEFSKMQWLLRIVCVIELKCITDDRMRGDILLHHICALNESCHCRTVIGRRYPEHSFISFSIISRT